MPPRRSAHVAAVVERESSTLLTLPLALALAIFALLPVDQRLLCREVCRGWRAVLEDVSLWLRLDLTYGSGGSTFEVTDALLQAAAARAGGRLEALDVSGTQVTQEALLAVARANALGLRELRVCHFPNHRLAPAAVEELLRAAPQLRSFTVHADGGTPEEALRMLRNEGVYAPLRLRLLWCTSQEMSNLYEGELVALAADIGAHTWLNDLALFHSRLYHPAALDAVVNAALTRHLSTVCLHRCALSPASAPALARLLGSASLLQLAIHGDRAHPRLLDAAASATLGAALRANSTSMLTHFHLTDVDFWHELGAARELLRALSMHRGVERAGFGRNEVRVAHRAAAGAALAEFVAAAPALKWFEVSECNLGDDGLGPLFDALPANTRLRILHCDDNGVSEAFVRDRLLPAVRANTSLRELKLQLPWGSAREAEALVEARTD
jgi:hypothetical protein